MKRSKPADHRDLILPEAPKQGIQVEERETRASPHAQSDLASIGRMHEGLDGKRYLASFAVHIYNVPNLVQTQAVTLVQSSDLSTLPESIAVFGIQELGRAVMKRYGRKPPRKRNETADAEITNV